MKWFDFLKREDGRTVDTATPLVNIPAEESMTSDRADDAPPPPEIPEKIFVEYEKPTPASMENNNTAQEVHNLQALYRYLEQNFEKKGYEDALVNPDSSYMQEHITFLQNGLNIMISKVNSYYQGHLRQVDFHIETRKRNEMVETVDELLTHKATVEDEMKIVATIESDAKKGNGITQNLILSYKRGFMNGFAAITYGTVLAKQNN